MKKQIEKHSPQGLKDYFAIAVTTFGVGYLPLAPGTWGSMVGVLIYIVSGWTYSAGAIINTGADSAIAASYQAWALFAIGTLFVLFCLLGIWASGRSTALFGDLDPSHAVVDEVIGQLIVFMFIPFTFSWPLILAGFLLFRLFDIWKPYPIDSLQDLPAGIGICADDILAGVYGGVCLALIYAITLSV